MEGPEGLHTMKKVYTLSRSTQRLCVDPINGRLIGLLLMIEGLLIGLLAIGLQ